MIYYRKTKEGFEVKENIGNWKLWSWKTLLEYIESQVKSIEEEAFVNDKIDNQWINKTFKVMYNPPKSIKKLTLNQFKKFYNWKAEFEDGDKIELYHCIDWIL